jgi:hypothetical protein
MFSDGIVGLRLAGMKDDCREGMAADGSHESPQLLCNLEETHAYDSVLLEFTHLSNTSVGSKDMSVLLDNDLQATCSGVI